jgi:hypothetical protein
VINYNIHYFTDRPSLAWDLQKNSIDVWRAGFWAPGQYNLDSVNAADVPGSFSFTGGNDSMKKRQFTRFIVAYDKLDAYQMYNGGQSDSSDNGGYVGVEDSAFGSGKWYSFNPSGRCTDDFQTIGEGSCHWRVLKVVKVCEGTQVNLDGDVDAFASSLTSCTDVYPRYRSRRQVSTSTGSLSGLAPKMDPGSGVR